jgi:hypothetical protein
LAKIVLPIVDQADVQPNSCHLGRQVLRFVQHFQCLPPLFSPHVDYAEVRVRARDLRIDSQNGPKSMIGFIQIATLKRSFTLLKQFLRISVLGRSCGRRFLGLSWLQCLRSARPTANK